MFVLMVLGQIIGATIADQIGLFGLQVKHVTLLKIISIIIILLGVFLLFKSDQVKVTSNKNSNVVEYSIKNDQT
ncbi:Putative inner membrane exporter, YdcZ [Thermoanaerobacter thermohydrosulfuricus]|nr:Putative inner membrane exporter, YdcZ [Thermoanaerobacter thermohydrosulfuricus]